ncbi:MAG TPA: zinc ribbon domain-containing protein, partial [Pyrinomonadaceae bacterium]
MTKSKSNIFCPNCAAKNKIEQNFCRFCGLDLRETANSLLAQFSTDEKARRFDKLKLIKKLSDLASIGLIFVIATGALFYLYLVSTKMIFSGERILFGLFLVFMISQFALNQIRRINRARSKKDETDLSPTKSENSENKETAKFLED